MTSLAWILAAAIGLGAGGFGFHFPGSYGDPEASLASGFFGLLIGGVNGVLLGTLLWAATRAPRRTGSRLVLAMGAAVGVTHALFDGSSWAVPYVVVVALSALAMGGAVRWVSGPGRRDGLVAGVAWAVGLLVAAGVERALGLPFSQTPIGWSTQHAIYGVVVGLLWGGATAYAGIPTRLRSGNAAP